MRERRPRQGGAVRPWLRNLLLYSPGVALLVVGIVLLLTVPDLQSAPCDCPQGTVCLCPSGTVLPSAGMILVAASALYSSLVFAVLRLARN